MYGVSELACDSYSDEKFIMTENWKSADLRNANKHSDFSRRMKASKHVGDTIYSCKRKWFEFKTFQKFQL